MSVSRLMTPHPRVHGFWVHGNPGRRAAARRERSPGVVLADDLEPTPSPPPHPMLLPGLDSTVMGWQARDWFPGEHAKALFDRTGNAGPTVWWAGRVVGGWTQRADGEVVFRLLEDAGQAAADQIAAHAARLQQWIGPVRVTPRFRTPLERELVG
jgi:hypothetical protein